MSWWQWLISALSAWALLWKEKFSKQAKDKQNAKEQFDKAVDDRDKHNVVDSFNDLN